MRHLLAVVAVGSLVAGSLVVTSLGAQAPGGSAANAASAAPAGWQVPRTPDGHPDLQGVWGNNSVTPMTRPRQWKDKTSLTEAEVEELKQMAPGSSIRAATRSSATSSSRCSTPRTRDRSQQVSYDPTTGNYNQFWMADREWDNRTSLIIDPPDGQFPPLIARGRGAPRGRAHGGEDARARRRPGGSAVVGALHLVRRAAHRGELQQLRPDLPVAARRWC